MTHHAEDHFGCCEGSGFPLIGDKFPMMKVKTTHGMINLPAG